MKAICHSASSKAAGPSSKAWRHIETLSEMLRLASRWFPLAFHVDFMCQTSRRMTWRRFFWAPVPHSLRGLWAKAFWVARKACRRSRSFAKAMLRPWKHKKNKKHLRKGFWASERWWIQVQPLPQSQTHLRQALRRRNMFSKLLKHNTRGRSTLEIATLEIGTQLHLGISCLKPLMTNRSLRWRHIKKVPRPRRRSSKQVGRRSWLGWHLPPNFA